MSGSAAGRISGWGRLGIYWLVLGALAIVTFKAVVALGEAGCNSPDFDGECDMAAFAGIGWALIAVVVGVVAIVVAEAVLAVRRRRARRTA